MQAHLAGETPQESDEPEATLDKKNPQLAT
jgi:hypothetical protein